MLRPLIVAAAVAVATILPLAAGAQSGAFVEPKRVTEAPLCLPAAGKGSVIVQVMVKKDGTFSVERVIKSTNPGDEAAALDIARHSEYSPATRGGVAVDAFKDFTVDFDGPAPGLAKSSEVCDAYALIRNGKYDDARALLNAYTQAHPDDQSGFLYLGLAAAFAKDAAAAVAALDRAGPIDPKYLAVVGGAYSDYATTLQKAGKYAELLTVTTRAIALRADDPAPLLLRALAENALAKYADAIADLQKAQSLAVDSKAPADVRAQIGASIMSVYFNSGDFEKGKAQFSEVAALDPTARPHLEGTLVNAVLNSARALSAAGKRADAVARYEAGAELVSPGYAMGLYAQAASVLSGDAKPDWKKVKAEADKALALDPDYGLGNFLAGVAVANDGKPKDAVPFLNKAKTSTAYSSDAAFAKQVDDALKSVTAAK